MSNDTVLNGRYRLIAQQGSGGMAVIYKAVDISLGRTVAVKVLRPSLTNDRAFLERFRDEARSVANLSHPNIVTVHDFGNDGPAYYIVMEFVEGQDLKQIIRTQGALHIERALSFAIQICAGIGFAHRAGLVHADIKPQNILVTREDVVKITDFGIAQAFSDTHPGERQDVVWGSPHYFAPEQARGEKPTPASDVYAIGIVMFEMLTGRLPYVGANQQELALAHIRERIPLVTEFNPNVPENLARIVEKIMGKEPGTRYRLADQLGQVLTGYRERGRQDTMPSPAMNVPPPNLPGQAAPPPASSVPTTPSRPPQVPLPAQPRPMPGVLPGAPTPAQPTQPAQSYPGVIPPPPSAQPTMRYSPAPIAPQQPDYARGGYPPAPMQAQSAAVQGQTPLPPPTMTQMQDYRLSGEHEEAPPLFDAVTIALAALAGIAVMCLIPLYLLVFQARAG